MEYLNASSRLSCAAQIPRLPLTHLVLDYQLDPQWLHLPLDLCPFVGGACALLNRIQAHLLSHVSKLSGEGLNARTRSRLGPALLLLPSTSQAEPDQAKHERQGCDGDPNLEQPVRALLARSRKWA